MRRELYVEYLGNRTSEYVMLEPYEEEGKKKKKAVLFEGGSEDDREFEL